MTGHAWLDVIISATAVLLLSWLALIIALAIRRPKGNLLKEALRSFLIFSGIGVDIPCPRHSSMSSSPR